MEYPKILISKNLESEYMTLHDKGDFADINKVKDFETGD